MHDGVDREGRTKLHYAAFDDNLEGAEALLAGGADPNARDRLGFVPLHLAAQQGSIRVARALLAAGAHVDPQNSYGNTPLFTSVFNSKGNGELINLLREHGANPQINNSSDQSPLGLSRLISNYDDSQFFSDLP